MQSSSQIVTINKPTPSFHTGRMAFLSYNQQVKSITFRGLAQPKVTCVVFEPCI